MSFSPERRSTRAVDHGDHFDALGKSHVVQHVLKSPQANRSNVLPNDAVQLGLILDILQHLSESIGKLPAQPGRISSNSP
jgi:hypothetical protein